MRVLKILIIHHTYLIIGLKTSFRQAVERARAAQGYDIGNQTASNAPIKEMTVAPEPVVSMKTC